MIAGSVFVGHCQKCHAAIGELTREELDFVVFNSDQQLLCFDCDGLNADLDPSFFLGLKEGDRFRIDDKCFDLEINVSGSRVLVSSRAHVSARAPGLSSSTYLNRNNEKSGVLDFIERGKNCLTCDGFGQYWYLGHPVECSACFGIGRIGDNVLLPLWLVSGARENA